MGNENPVTESVPAGSCQHPLGNPLGKSNQQSPGCGAGRLIFSKPVANTSLGPSSLTSSKLASVNVVISPILPTPSSDWVILLKTVVSFTFTVVLVALRITSTPNQSNDDPPL